MTTKEHVELLYLWHQRLINEAISTLRANFLWIGLFRRALYREK